MAIDVIPGGSDGVVAWKDQIIESSMAGAGAVGVHMLGLNAQGNPMLRSAMTAAGAAAGVAAGGFITNAEGKKVGIDVSDMVWTTLSVGAADYFLAERIQGMLGMGGEMATFATTFLLNLVTGQFLPKPDFLVNLFDKS